MSRARGFFPPCQAGVCEVSVPGVLKDTPPGLQGWEQVGTRSPGPHPMGTKAAGSKTRKGPCGGERPCQVGGVAHPPGTWPPPPSLRPPSSPSASGETLAQGLWGTQAALRGSLRNGALSSPVFKVRARLLQSQEASSLAPGQPTPLSSPRPKPTVWLHALHEEIKAHHPGPPTPLSTVPRLRGAVGG